MITEKSKRLKSIHTISKRTEILTAFSGDLRRKLPGNTIIPWSTIIGEEISIYLLLTELNNYYYGEYYGK